MKKVFLLIGLLVLFVGCKQPEKNYFSESPEIETSKQLRFAARRTAQLLNKSLFRR
jgi:hypothetical protein